MRGRHVWLSPIAWLLIAGCATSGTGQGAPPGGGSSVGVGVGAGSGGVGVSSGMQVSPGNDPVMSSTMMGAAIGAMGGPIGLGVGAIVGLIRGLHQQSQIEKHAKNEMVRQAQIDNELERQLEAMRTGAHPGMGASVGLILIEDHLVPESGTVMAQVPPTPPSAGEGLVLLSDNTALPEPQAPNSAEALKRSPLASIESRTDEEGAGTATDEQKKLEEQVAAARERARKLREALEGSVAPSETPRVASIPAAKPPPPTIDSEGFRHVYEGGRLVRKERNVNGDTMPDIIRYYDETGRLVREEEDSRLDGRLDTWTFHKDGRPIRKESDTTGDGKVDLWAFYDETGDLVRTETDTNADSHRDLVILYAQGAMVEEQRYRPGREEHPRSIVTYVNGLQTRKAEDTDGDGRIDRVTEFDGSGHVTKISRDTAGRGTFNLYAYYEAETGTILREEEDLTGDKIIDVISYYEKGQLVRREFFDLPEDIWVKPQVPLASVPSELKSP